MVLTATSSPTISVGIEGDWLALSIGTGFRWLDYGFTYKYDEIDRNESVAVIRPALSLTLIGRSANLSRYFTMRAGKEIPFLASVDGYVENDAYEERLKDRYDDYWLSGGVGLRKSLSESFSLGAEVGVWFEKSDEELKGRYTWSRLYTNYVSTYFNVAAWFYP
jgi:hypothetical protein